MSLFLRIALIIVLNIASFYYFPQPVSAIYCDFAFEPTPDQNMEDFTVTATSKDLSPGEGYFMILRLPNGNLYGTPTQNLTFDKDTGASYKFPKPSFGGKGWQEGTYTVFFAKNISLDSLEKEYSCKKTFEIGVKPQQNCEASIPTKPIEPDTNVILHVKNLAKNQRPGLDITGSGGYDIIINQKINQVYSKENDNEQDIDLGIFDVGTYLVEVKNRCGWVGINCPEPPRNQCNPVGFKVGSKDSGEGGEIPPDEVSQNPNCKEPGDQSIVPGVDSICTNSEALGCGPNAIRTAIGCVRTNLTEFVQDLLKFAFGISGGIAFLMMLLGAFQMLTSAGNPDTLRAGRERLSSAAIGLLIIIFAVLLLQIVGVGILNIPGFS